MEVAVPMCADFLHPGHLHLLEAAAKHGKVTVWLMTDAAMQTYKRKPFFKYADRKDILLALCTVLPCNGPNDYICICPCARHTGHASLCTAMSGKQGLKARHGHAVNTFQKQPLLNARSPKRWT